eukprot:scaffold1419_cov410-Prasinococcus_capsulatus_cf.AAC.31
MLAGDGARTREPAREAAGFARTRPTQKGRQGAGVPRWTRRRHAAAHADDDASAQPPPRPRSAATRLQQQHPPQQQPQPQQQQHRQQPPHATPALDWIGLDWTGRTHASAPSGRVRA